jgi:hypothetical protein
MQDRRFSVLLGCDKPPNSPSHRGGGGPFEVVAGLDRTHDLPMVTLNSFETTPSSQNVEIERGDEQVEKERE